MIRNCLFRSRAFVFAISLSSGLSWSTVALAQHGDVLLADVGGQVAIGSGSDVGPVNADLTRRVFEGVMIPSFPPPTFPDYGRDDPGFFALPARHAELPAGASALPGNAAVTVNLLPLTIGGRTDMLFFWNGVGAIDFQPIATAQPGVAMAITPNPVGNSGGSGGLDLHPAFTLDNGGAGVPADGVYLISPTASVAGLTDSDRFFMVWLVDALLVDEDAAEELEEALEMGNFVVHGKNFAFFEAAVDFVHDQVAVPEPSGFALATMTFAALGVALRSRSA